jgi:serine/threonine-protein kinase
MAAPLPKTIGRYEIVSLIGRGGMGVLYRAKDPTLERDVALKMMLVDFSFDQTARERFEREAKAVAKLQHHNVVTIHELGQHDNAPYIVMELLGGEDLEAVMRRSEPLPLPTKLEIVAQLCEGLAYAHEQGIVHRDIKPGNVRVLEDGTVKILDFGIAKFAQSSMTQSGMVMGTAYYMAPEQILGNPVDGRADLFSVGVLLHELLSGQKPFAGDSPTAVVYQIVHAEARSIADSVPDLPDGLNDIVARALKKDPNERYSRATDMASDLRLVKMMLDLPLTQMGATTGVTSTGAVPPPPKLHATGGVPRVTRPASAGTVKLTAPRQVSTAAIAAVAAGIIVTGGLVMYFIQGRGDQPAQTATVAPAASAAQTGSPATTPAATTAKPGATLVVITSAPSGARISLNGSDTGKVTPSAVSVDAGKPGTIELALKGYDTLSATLGAGDLKRGNREFQLARQPAPVHLVASGPFAFEIVRGGAVLSAAATHHDLTVAPGAEPVMARNAEYILNESIAIDFLKAEAALTLKAPGILAVFAALETCSILVDGHDVGYPPLPRKPIAAGPHTVVQRCKDGKEDSRKIVVASGERTAVTFGPPKY